MFPMAGFVLATAKYDLDGLSQQAIAAELRASAPSWMAQRYRTEPRHASKSHANVVVCSGTLGARHRCDERSEYDGMVLIV